MRIGFDVDGVLADFSKGYMALIIKLSGRDLFAPGDWDNPPCWDWDKFRGYTAEERAMAWKHIVASATFWEELTPLPGNYETLRDVFYTLNGQHELYFITNRTGVMVKRQTENWLRYYLNLIHVPTVLITGHGVKGLVAKALNLDAYLDDNFDNCLHCLEQAPTTHTYLLDRSYNRVAAELIMKKDAGWAGPPGAHIARVDEERLPTLSAFLHAEGLVSYTESVANIP